MDPFIGEIRIFTGNFAPTGWFLCQGQLLPISAYQALFAIIGTFYGGNGTSNFQLPNLQGRFPIGVGQAQSGQIYNLGEVGGVPQVTMTLNNLPAHNHLATFTPTGGSQLNAQLMGSPNAGTTTSPQGNYLANIVNDQSGTTDPIYVPQAQAGTLAPIAGLSVTGQVGGGTVAVQNTGSGLPVETISPYLGINYIIAYNGIFPSRG